MARVVVYERAVDAVITDVTFYNKLNRTLNGIKIKEEPLDPDIGKPDDSLSVRNATEVVRPRTPPLEDQLSNSLNNKEYESAPAKEHAEPETNKPNVDSQKCKRSPSKNTKVEKSPRSKKHRSYKRCSLDAADYRRKRRTRPSAMIKCDVCSLCFRTQRTLKRHKASHDKSDKCSCDVCGSVFTSTMSLLRHKAFCAPSQQLDNEAGYYCYFCKQKFTAKKPLRTHLFLVHGDEILSPKIVINKTQPNTEITQTTNNPVTDACTEQVSGNFKNSLNSTPAKKMRQTTLTEFLSLFGQHNGKKQKEECVDSQKSGVAINQDQALGSHANPLPCDKVTTVKATESSAPAVPTVDQSDSSNRPFVHIHVNTNMMMSLLNTEIKTEPEDFRTPATSHYTSYNLRRPRTDSTRCPSHLQKKRRRTTQSYQRDMVLWERQMSAKFGCRECVVRLEKCDLTLNSERKPNGLETIPLQEGVLNAEGNPEIGRRKSVRSLSAMNLEAPLVWANKNATNSAVKKLEIASNGTHESKDSNIENEHKVLQCKVCKKSFSSKENIREHMKLFHVAYISSVCSASYTSMSKLLDHYLRQHAVFRRKQCCVCYEKIDTPVQLKQHMSLHCIRVIRSKKNDLSIDGETMCNVFKKHYQCRSCSRRFWLKSCWQQHEKVSHPTKNKTKNPASPSKKRPANTVNSSSVHVSCDSNVSEPHPSDHSTQTPDKTKISGAVVNQESLGNSYSGNSDDCSVPTPQCKLSQSQKVTSIRKLVNGMACVKGYQIDMTGTDKKKFPCSVCGKQFQTFRNLCIHERTFSTPSDNQCGVCGTSFTTKRLLQQHMQATHTFTYKEGYKFFCKFCNQGFIKMANLQIHERHFHTTQSPINPSPRLHNEHVRTMNTVCTVCNLMFESYERFIEHSMYYYKSQIFTCTFCSQSFQGMYMLHHHNKLMHYPEGTRSAYIYTCDICNEGFNQESHFHAHKLHVHLHETSSAQNSLRIIQDQTCQDHSYALTANNVTSADGTTSLMPIITYTCEICNLSFTNQSDLSSHEMEYSNEGDFQCSTCGRRYPNAAILTKHHSLNHSGHDVNNCYKCHSCGEVLTTDTAMACHEKHFHTANNADRRSMCNASSRLDANQNTYRKTADQTNNTAGNLTCLTCGMRFENEIKLKDHLLEYSNTGDYLCEVCHRKFVDMHQLEVHRIKHSRLNNILTEHHCPICNEGFASAASIPIHVLHLHRYETFPSDTTKRPYTPPNTKMNSIGKRHSHEIGSAKVNQTNGKGEMENSDFNGGRMCNGTQFDAMRETSSNTEGGEGEQSTHVTFIPAGTTKPPNSISPSANETQVQGPKCPECGVVFNSHITLTRHRSRFANSGEYACKYCSRQFDRYNALDAHLLKHSVDFQRRFLKYGCSHCGEKFRTPISVYSHVVHIHGKSKLKEKCIITNRSEISNLVLEYSKFGGIGALMGKVVSNDDLETDHVHDSATENVDVWNYNGQQEISPSTTRNSVNEALKSVTKEPKTVTRPLDLERTALKSMDKPLNTLSKQLKLVTVPLNSVITTPHSVKEVSNSVQEKGDSQNLEEKSLYYTCPVCREKYPTLMEFQTHFKVSHRSMVHKTIAAPQQIPNPNTVECVMCNSTFCNESEFREHMERLHPPYPPTRQAVPQKLTSSPSSVARDTVENVWEKNSTITPSIESLNSQDPLSSVNELESLPPATVATVKDEVGKLKVKSFARMVN